MEERRLQEAEILSILEGTRRIDIELGEEQQRAVDQYARTHARRYLLSLDLLRGRLPPLARVFSVGSMPNHLELLLAHLFGAEVVGSTFRGLDGRDRFDASYQLPTGERYAIPTLLCDLTQEDLPVPDHDFDCVLCFEVVEHLLESPARMLSEIRRILRPGGLLALSTPNAQYWHRLVYLANGICYPDVSYEEPVQSRHHHLYTHRELSGWLQKAGFEVVDVAFARVWEQLGNLVPLDLEDPFNQALADLLRSREEFRHDNLFVLARPSVEVVKLVATSGWYPEERSGLSWWRWSLERGTILLAVAEAGRFLVLAEVQSAMEGNSVELLVDGHSLGLFGVRTGRFHPFQVELDLGAGEHRLELRSGRPPVLLPPDERPLAFAVKDLRLRAIGR